MRMYTISVYVKYIGPKISKKNPTVTGPMNKPLPQGTVSIDAMAPVTSRFEFAQARVVGISTALTAPRAMVDSQITEWCTCINVASKTIAKVESSKLEVIMGIVLTNLATGTARTRATALLKNRTENIISAVGWVQSSCLTRKVTNRQLKAISKLISSVSSTVNSDTLTILRVLFFAVDTLSSLCPSSATCINGETPQYNPDFSIIAKQQDAATIKATATNRFE